jgi:hypothetical protein
LEKVIGILITIIMKVVYRFQSSESTYEDITNIDEGMLYELPIELDIKSATTYQTSFKTGFKYVLNNYEKTNSECRNVFYLC